MTTEAPYDAVIIGAGLAGLTAAHVLSRNRWRIALVEARTRVGGRAYSIPMAGGALDAGATWFWENEPLISDAISNLRLETYPQNIDGDALFQSIDGDVRRLDGNPIDQPAFRLVGGAQQLAQALAVGLPRGILRLGSPVSSVAIHEDELKISTETQELCATQAILAVPPALAVDQITFQPGLPHPMAEAARCTPVWMAGMVKAIGVYDTDFWRRQGLSGAAISYAGPFREFHDHSGPEGTPAAIFGFAPADALANADSDEIAAAFASQLTRIFGDDATSTREILVTDWSREPFTQPTNRSDSMRTPFGANHFQSPIHDRLYWATTETAQAFGGHMEGAMRAGLSAAQRVESSLVNKR